MCVPVSRSVISDSLQPHRPQPTRLLCPQNSPGKNIGVGCHFLLLCMKVKSESEVAQSCLTLSDSMGFSRQECWSEVPLPSLVLKSSWVLFFIIQSENLCILFYGCIQILFNEITLIFLSVNLLVLFILCSNSYQSFPYLYHLLNY